MRWFAVVLLAVALLAVVSAGCFSPSPQAGAPCANGQCPSPLVCSPASGTCEREAIDAAMIDAPTDAAVPDVMPSAFMYRRQITIENTSSMTMPAGLTIRVPGALLGSLVQQGKVRSDFADLRVIGTVAGERDRIIDAPGGVAPASLWFSLATSLAPGQSTSDFFLYYGAPTATIAPTNGSAVFAVYDDFTNGIANFWLKSDAPATTSGQLVLRANHTDAVTTMASSDKVPIVSAIDLVATISNPDSDPTTHTNGTFFYWFGYQHTGDFTESDPWIVWIARGKGAVKGEQKSPVGCETECVGADVAQNTAPHYYAIERDPGASRFSRDGVLSFTSSVTNSADYSVMVRNFAAASEVRVDFVRARARVSPDPTVTVGAEQLN
jgi:hypothetical protein